MLFISLFIVVLRYVSSLFIEYLYIICWVVCLSIIKKGEIARLYIQAISSLSGFDDLQTSTTETNKFYLVFYEFYILGMSLTFLLQGNTSKSVSVSSMKYSGTTGMFT